ncbi:hypothetical protein IB229_14700 [Pseudomonas sp. PDM14]|uniref:hypothetical protein n=1 Tax=Pseudomonas sp. PDM14 TaxID=2769288 RepID=UPI00177D1464|nr:hypothetical protein [Pseudomonas sp. PDM14]MBD9484232.1 hypothetical protein [Pseudomonas sp. PDM14]
MRIDAGHLTERLAASVQRPAARNAADSVESGENTVTGSVQEGVRVTLSELGRARSTEKNKDIDDSDLPDTVKDLLKMIRSLKQQLAAKQAELDALMAAQNLDDSRRTKTEALQTEINSLQSALTGANASLIKAMRDAGLSPEQMQTAGTLALG